MKIFTLRVWILVVALFFAILALNPQPWAHGLQVKSVAEGSQLSLSGITPGQKILAINGVQLDTPQEFYKQLALYTPEPVTITLITDKGTFDYTTRGKLGFIQQNLTIVSLDPAVELPTAAQGAKILSLNGQPVLSVQDLNTFIKTSFSAQNLVITTNDGEKSILLTEEPQIIVTPAQTTNIQKGLDLAGGTRVLLKPVSETAVTDQQILDLIAVLSNRLNVYGLADLKIRPASDLSGNKFVLVEIAGATREEVRDLVAKQGKFEAKIGDKVVFEGGHGDIPFVCRNDGTCAGIVPPCNQLSADQWTCRFQFAISLSDVAAELHAQITQDLDTNLTQGDTYLSKTMDFYLDGKQVDSLRIAADLKGQKATRISITGPGYGVNEELAYSDALKQMDKLQTILITGSLPFGLEIVKMDTISASAGQEFVKNSILIVALSVFSVCLIVYLRYRQFKIVFPMIIIIFSELILTLGIAAFISWNIDLASIAGIIAAVGTGVNDQVIVVDELLRRRDQQSLESIKEKIKRAFTVVFASFATIAAAMLPLWNAGAGLVRGFAVTTLIGITIGVFITRPAFASMMETLLKTN